MYIKSLPSIEVLESLFICNAEAGTLTHRHRPLDHFPDERMQKSWNTRYAGKEAGRLRKGGYRTISIQNKIYPTHRVVYKMVTGEDPGALYIDHKDMTQACNHFANLQLATALQNNRKKREHSKPTSSKYKGVAQHRTSSKWMAYINVEYKRIYLGLFADELAAHRRYCLASLFYFEEFANFGESSPFTREDLQQEIFVPRHVRTLSSKYKGVTQHGNGWMSQIAAGKKHIYVGYFASELEAHRQYCLAALKYHGTAADFGKSSPFTRDNLTSPPASSKPPCT